MKTTTRALGVAMILLALVKRGNTQNTAATATAMPVESEMIAYEAIGKLAQQVRVAATDISADRKILYASPNNLAAITSYQSFVGLGDQLAGQYAAAGATPIGSGLLSGPSDISTVIKTMSDILSNLKAGGSQTSATFAPVEQVLISDLEKEFQTRLVTFAYPDKYVDGNTLIANEFSKVAKARAAAFIRFHNQNDQLAVAEAAKVTDPKEKAKILAAAKKYNPGDEPELKPVETVFASFQSILSGTNAGSIIQGAVLTASLTKPYDILTITIAAAGGGDRANTYFLVNLLFPQLHHSYNGGAVIAFTIRHSDGSYGTGGTIRQVYGYEKWHQPKLHGGPSRLTP